LYNMDTMLKSTVFRAALAISLSLHIFAVSAGGLFRGKPPVEKEREIEVAYLLAETPEEVINEEIIENLPKEYDLRKEELRQSAREKKVAEDGSVKAEGALSEEQYLEQKELERLEEYIQYYELIREKIKKLVARNYRASRKEGAVEVAFVLDKKGALKNVSVDDANSAPCEALRETALKSIKQCSPFPPPPEALGKRDITFSLAIIFKRK